MKVKFVVEQGFVGNDLIRIPPTSLIDLPSEIPIYRFDRVTIIATGKTSIVNNTLYVESDLNDKYLSLYPHLIYKPLEYLSKGAMREITKAFFRRICLDQIPNPDMKIKRILEQKEDEKI